MEKAPDITKPRYSSEQICQFLGHSLERVSTITLLFTIFFFLHVFVEVLSRKRINLTSMAGVYVVLGVGLVVAYLVLIAEIIWKRK